MTQEHDPTPVNGSSSDPTALSTQALLREIYNLRELLTTQINGVDEKVTARFDGMDKAIALLQAQADKVPSEVDLKTVALKDLLFEKFSAVDTQFRERDVRTEQTARDAKTAVDAALQAAKEAVGKQNDFFAAATEKTEAAFTKQIDAMAQLIMRSDKSLEDKINDNKDRLTLREGRGNGMDAAWGYLIGAVGLVGGMVAIVIALQG